MAAAAGDLVKVGHKLTSEGGTSLGATGKASSFVNGSTGSVIEEEKMAIHTSTTLNQANAQSSASLNHQAN